MASIPVRPTSALGSLAWNFPIPLKISEGCRTSGTRSFKLLAQRTDIRLLPDGNFTGLTNTSNGLIYFRGIPFADPPVGALRWQAPNSPPTKNLGHLTTTDFGPACIDTTQTNSGATTSEDCLYGNVYLPIGTTADAGLPVLVYFYGGGFESGRTNKYPPENLVLASKSPFIMATFGYRLGQFGFLAGSVVHDNGVPNVGLLDQKAALQWVQKYIANFGGDPGAVTIWGQSAGAASVVYHLIANAGNANPPFSQAIGDSPPILYLPNYNDAFSENLFSTFAANAGCGTTKVRNTTAAIMQCLRAATVKTIATAGSQTLQNFPTELYPFGPVFDGAYIQQRPVEALLSGNFAQVPVLFGSNTDEGANWSAKLADPANTSSPTATETTVNNFLTGQYPTLSSASFQEAIDQYYPLSDYNGSFSLQGQQMYGEMRFICSAVLASNAFANSNQLAYQYHWDNPTLGSTHSDELVVFFNQTIVFDSPDQTLALAMRDYWTSFITSGTPTSDATGAPTWPTVDGENTEHGVRLLLQPGNIAVEAVSDDLSQRCTFWHDLAGQLFT
ncbi:Alpha/Beta hydrolase protein [Roridomyces roridus]|uniref:Carboxylic ester hydrolase n=1 Tax=Roridomyces roridus TaxID=1738132 RepID=A0AAD7B6K8_9AGAR|nr:Alpha/Beta hydrolase protein [Roridomyces roridus]